MSYRPNIPRDYKLFRHDHARPAPAVRRAWLAGGGICAAALLALALWPGGDGSAGNEPEAAAAVSRSLALPGRDASRTRPPDDAAPAAEGSIGPVPTPGAIGALERETASASLQGAFEPEHDWQTIRVRPGDTLAAIFSRHGLGPATVHHVVYGNEHTARLRDLKPGEELTLALDKDGGLAALRFDLDEARLGEVFRSGDELRTRVIERPIETRIARVSGVIDDSLYRAAKNADLSDALIMNLAHIFGWDIDFVYDIRAGDQFHLIYQELYRDGEKLRDGEVLAATFLNRDRRITAVRYESAEGAADYYTPDGRNMRKEFLRTPVDFRRISSRFNPNRMHPIHGYRRPHRGVDYAADTGTPVIATGHGRVAQSGWNGGYGNSVIVEHAGRYSTLYGHLSRLAVKKGARVRQGQVIGHVGMTGTATGPHLHYEFRVDGVHRDPLKVEFPPAPPLPESQMAGFRQKAQPLLAQLDAMRGEGMLALRDE